MQGRVSFDPQSIHAKATPHASAADHRGIAVELEARFDRWPNGVAILMSPEEARDLAGELEIAATAAAVLNDEAIERA
jgi:hypothetical protein